MSQQNVFLLTTKTFIGALVFAVGLQAQSSQQSDRLSNYNKSVLADNPVMFLNMGSPRLGIEQDLSGNGNAGRYFPSVSRPRTVRMPNGEYAADFNGLDQYLEIRSAANLSVPTTGILTLEAWIRPRTLEFPKVEGSGYVYWMGKGMPNEHEYAMRMYSYTNAENRPNRISGYAFNLTGGLGSGAYFQDAVKVDQWLHVTLVINTKATSATYPTGYVKIYKNKRLRQTQGLHQFDVIPGAGSAPLRIATRSLNSFFLGAIGKVAVYDYELKPAQIVKHQDVMCKSGGCYGAFWEN
ncbi:LamG domain-containing protein [Bdellovibrio reynosensis]|uniref:LamG domain-containing protein n=1 Tax=Bdellovibrio reynosensis TaxID=2835041 RepID=A0ABY4CCK3_9BACT|nr:LamG domain-containing protein [Bdellovibrio reynosensis]UOF02568.1 LamG domain-containing protein [Bdellovibrio reynosensis]